MGLHPECSEPRPVQMKLPIAHEILTFLAEAALENEHIDKAMAAMGITKNLKEEENVIAVRGGGSTSVQSGLGHATRQGLPCRELKDDIKVLGQLVDLEHVIRHRKGTTNCCSLERSTSRHKFRMKRCTESLEQFLLQWSSEFVAGPREWRSKFGGAVSLTGKCWQRFSSTHVRTTIQGRRAREADTSRHSRDKAVPG